MNMTPSQSINIMTQELMKQSPPSLLSNLTKRLFNCSVLRVWSDLDMAVPRPSQTHPAFTGDKLIFRQEAGPTKSTCLERFKTYARSAFLFNSDFSSSSKHCGSASGKTGRVEHPRSSAVAEGAAGDTSESGGGGGGDDGR